MTWTSAPVERRTVINITDQSGQRRLQGFKLIFTPSKLPPRSPPGETDADDLGHKRRSRRNLVLRAAHQAPSEE